MRALAEARALGFLGPGPLDVHVASASAFAAALVAVDAEGPGLDLGSGGGVPGLPLAVALPSWDWTLVDAQQRRTAFLQKAVEDLGLSGRVRIIRGRAEELGHDPALRGQFGVVTARSFGPPLSTAENAVAFLRPGGVLVVSEPPENAGTRWDDGALTPFGLRVVHVAAGTPGMAVLRAVAPCPVDVPRRWKRQRDPLT